jgi:protein required for attachment to host cells
MKVLLKLADGSAVAVLDPKELTLFAAVPPDEGRTYTADTAKAIADAKTSVAALLNAGG